MLLRAIRINGGSIARIAGRVSQLPLRMGLPCTEASVLPAGLGNSRWGSPHMAFSTSVASHGSVCAPECPGCGVSHLDPDGAVTTPDILWMGRAWHRNCLRCHGCERELAPSSALVAQDLPNQTATPAILRDGAPLCAACYVRSGSARCSQCDKSALPTPEFLIR